MCRSIKTLYNYDPPATDDEIVAAARQYVRKISGYQKPSVANEQAFAAAVGEVTEATRRLLAHLVTIAPSRDREAEAARKRELARARFG
jgi:hypothetical protein